MGGLSYFTVRHFLLAGRESAAQHQTFDNAVLVRSSLVDGHPDHEVHQSAGQHRRRVRRALGAVPAVQVVQLVPVGQRVVHSPAAAQGRPKRHGGHTDRSQLAARHRDRGGRAGPLGARRLLRGVRALGPRPHPPRARTDASVVAAMVTTVLGIALGRFASARSLRPLAEVSRAAGAIAGGELDTRLDADDADPDLDGLTNSFNAMVDQLQERIEREARFNSDVSHELRSPLTTLAASLEVLEADRDRAAPRVPASAPAARATTCAASSAWSATCWRCRGPTPGRPTSSSKRSTCPSWCSARSRRVRPHGRPRAEAAQRRRDGARSPPACDDRRRVGVDKRRFERVMANLMENAAHYGGGVTGRSRSRPADDGNRRRSRSTSTTPGRASTRRARRGSSSASTAGRRRGARHRRRAPGSGLALVAEHMRGMHGGPCGVSSAGGRGPLRPRAAGATWATTPTTGDERPIAEHDADAGARWRPLLAAVL